MGKQNQDEADSLKIEVRQIDPKTFVMHFHGGLKINTHEKFLESFRALPVTKGTTVVIETGDSFCISNPGYQSLVTACKELKSVKGFFAIVDKSGFLEDYELIAVKKSILKKFDSVEKAISELRK